MDINLIKSLILHKIGDYYNNLGIILDIDILSNNINFSNEEINLLKNPKLNFKINKKKPKINFKINKKSTILQTNSDYDSDSSIEADEWWYRDTKYMVDAKNNVYSYTTNEFIGIKIDDYTINYDAKEN